MNEIDFSPYLKTTRFSAPRGIILGMQLITAAPASPSERVRQALARVREETVRLQDHARERIGAGNAALREHDQRIGAAWVGARMRLEGLARIASPEVAARAEALLRQMLPDGTGFVQGDYTEQFTTTANLLRRIDDLGLAPAIDELVSPELLPGLRASHAAFGEALGVGETAMEVRDTRAIQAQIGELARAIAAYGRVLAGEVDAQDEASVAAFLRAMSPLDVHRRTFFGSNGAEPDEPTAEPTADPVDEDGPRPSDPVPPLPA